MGQQSVRQAARRAAREGQAERRRERVERERRLEGLGVDVAVALSERDAAVAEAERRAGVALRQMTDGEGLTVREAVQWCGGEITVREVARLRLLAADDDVDDDVDDKAHEDADGDTPVPATAPAEPGDAGEGRAPRAVHGDEAAGEVVGRGRDAGGRAQSAAQATGAT